MIIPDEKMLTAPGALVLVTGATGFLGAYVVRDLITSGYRVRAIRRKPYVPHYIEESIITKVEWFDSDILDVGGLNEAMQGVSAVIHSAGVVSFLPRDRNLLYQTNIEGTANVVNTAIDNNIPRFVHVSSVASLGKKADGSLIDETAPWQENKWTTAYAKSKYQGEMHVWRGIAEGLNGVIVNPSTIIGYGDWNSSSTAIFKNIYSGFPWYSEGATGFVDVEDVSRAIVRLMATNIHSERFIVNGSNTSYKQLFDQIADAFKRKRPSMKATPLLGSVAWRLEKLKAAITGKNPLLSRETARIAQSKTQFDNSKILNALPGFSFTPFDDTIRKACEKYLAAQK